MKQKSSLCHPLRMRGRSLLLVGIFLLAAFGMPTAAANASNPSNAAATVPSITSMLGASGTKRVVLQNAKRNGPAVWKKKSQYYYCYQGGRKLTGLQKVGEKTYLFDKAGRQQTGWRLVDGTYRYFTIANGKKGCMVTGRTINDVRLNRKGAAAVTSDIKRKLNVMVRFQLLADQLVKPGMKKSKKLVVVFKYARDRRYRSIGSPPAVGDWDAKHAEMFLNSNYADCVMAACGFAYLANAIGYQNISLRLYGHGHAEIDNLIYDPGFAKTVSDDNYTVYFGKTYQQLPAWGTGAGIPRKIV